jgi:hypothetical protein
MIVKQELVAIYRYSAGDMDVGGLAVWFLEVYRVVGKDEYWIYHTKACDADVGEFDTKNAFNPEPWTVFPTWHDGKWFFDHLGG